MCLAIPSRITEIENLTATIDVLGAARKISLILLPEPAAVDDYVLVHAGFALQKICREDALDSIRILHEIARQMEEEDPLKVQERPESPGKTP
ncbi:MAG: HypC/HybG/HupF family hydrogenase formation chaperone [Deltaproteobacteria bacterium]|nr:HypC/HybG/HupF family hydrogenase formation chaperone [Deltaproteobacteria bacterium]